MVPITGRASSFLVFVKMNVDFGRMKRDLGLKLSSCLRPQGRSLLKLFIDSLYPEKSGGMFCIISMVKSCQSYIYV